MIRFTEFTQTAAAFAPRLSLLLYALLPVTEATDWLYYACAALTLASFAVFIAASVVALKNDKEEWMDNFCGDRRTGMYDMFIAIAGLTVGLALHNTGNSIFWGVILALVGMQYAFPQKFKRC
ncbi:MAG: hypothetical protein K2L56_08380 [Prevotella sp.]|nr:hypothetical protein [Prevotella sp.]